MVGHPWTNPNWENNVLWRNSPEGQLALAAGYAFVETPSKFTKIRNIYESLYDPDYIESHLNQLGQGCLTNVSIPNNNLPDTLQTTENPNTLRALADTGADLNVISSRVAKGLVERGVGLVGKGKYRIVDAFERVRIFHEHITFNLVFDDIKTNSEKQVFTITAVIIDIPLLSSLIIGLPSIKKFKLFRLLPELVEGTDSTDGESEIDWDKHFSPPAH